MCSTPYAVGFDGGVNVKKSVDPVVHRVYRLCFVGKGFVCVCVSLQSHLDRWLAS